MKNWKFFIGLLLAFSVGCEKSMDTVPTVILHPAKKEYELILKLNKTVWIEPMEVSITLSQVIEGRCPKGAECFLPSHVSVILTLSNGESETRVFLSKGFCFWPNSHPAVSIMGLDIILKDVFPYPSGFYFYPSEEDYQVVLTIGKGGTLGIN